VIHDAEVYAATAGAQALREQIGQRRFAPAVEPTPSLIESPNTTTACASRPAPDADRKARICVVCAGANVPP